MYINTVPAVHQDSPFSLKPPDLSGTTTSLPPPLLLPPPPAASGKGLSLQVSTGSCTVSRVASPVITDILIDVTNPSLVLSKTQPRYTGAFVSGATFRSSVSRIWRAAGGCRSLRQCVVGAACGSSCGSGWLWHTGCCLELKLGKALFTLPALACLPCCSVGPLGRWAVGVQPWLAR